MTLKIEKESKWSVARERQETNYYVWADDECIGACNTEEEANKIFDRAKTEFSKKSVQVLREEKV